MNLSPESPSPAVSVILPVWNPGSGIERCIKSLRKQTLREIEMIFVDDRGSDGAMEKVNAAAAEDPRIRILTNPHNLGPGPARNAGMAAARGEFVIFIDPDDYIDLDFLERLYEKTEAERLDIVKGCVKREDSDGQNQRTTNTNNLIRQRLKSGLPLYLALNAEHFSVLIRRQLLLTNRIRYGSYRISEDSYFLLCLGYFGGSFGICDSGSAYHYVRRPDSRMNQFTAESLFERLHTSDEMADFLAQQSIDEFALMFFCKRVRYLLSVQLLAAQKPETKNVSAEFLSRLRDQTKALPDADKMAQMDFVVYALVRHEINLIKRPWNHFVSRRPDLAEICDYLRRWIIFLIRACRSIPFWLNF